MFNVTSTGPGDSWAFGRGLMMVRVVLPPIGGLTVNWTTLVASVLASSVATPSPFARTNRSVWVPSVSNRNWNVFAVAFTRSTDALGAPLYHTWFVGPFKN